MIGWQRRLFSYARPEAAGLVGVGLLTLASVAADLLRPWPLKLILDYVVAAKPLPPEWQWMAHLPGALMAKGLVVWLAAAMLAIVLVGWLLRIARYWLEIGIGFRLSFLLGGALLDRLQHLSLTFHARHATGDLVKRVITDTACTKSLVIDFSLPLLTSLLTLIAMVGVLWHLSPPLALLAVGVIPTLFLVIRVFQKPMTERALAEYNAQGDLMGTAERSLTALPLVQAFGTESREEGNFAHVASRMGSAHLDNIRKQLHFKISGNAILALGSASVLTYGGLLVQQGRMTLGDLVVFLDYLLALYEPLNLLAYLFAAYTGAAAAAQRVLPLLDHQDEVREPESPLPLPSPVRGSLQFEDVGFSYEPGRPVFQNVSLTVKPGEFLAIVGPTGIGKSTLVSLIPRLYDCTHGRVLLDGIDVRRIPLQKLRAQVSMVLQESFLLPMSIRENIAYAKQDASMAEIELAARRARAHDFIEALPSGYDTVIGERGCTLSGGERQRLSIARAFLKDAPILILDEATAALDSEAESAVLSAIDALTAGRTTLLITHRISAARRADRVVELSEGGLMESSPEMQGV